MSTRTTTYPGSPPDRNHNMAVAARSLDGRLLPPGGDLSFNATIGETTAERGYRYGPVFYGNRVGRGLGGGVCQVASTLYGAARGSNLTILERHPHGLRVPYLPGGEDATVANPVLDLRIRNATSGPILIRAAARGPTVTVSIYGTQRPPRTWFYHRILGEQARPTLRIADPSLPRGREVEAAHGSDGLTVHTWFAVRRSDGTTTVTDLGVDHYRPSPRIVRVGTGPADRPVPPARTVDVGC
jgi:vancomycin resistance protein VanW